MELTEVRKDATGSKESVGLANKYVEDWGQDKNEQHRANIGEASYPLTKESNSWA